MNRRIERVVAMIVIAWGALGLVGCGGSEPYVGDMDDRSYSGQVTPERTVARESAAGGSLSITAFKGRFVWAEYAAPWCSYCASQAAAVKGLAAETAGQAVFLTVMTSGDHGAAASRETAAAWAQRFDLSPDRVVAAPELASWTVPTHVLYSPEGHTLYRGTGLMAADQLRAVLKERMAGWNEWRKSGKKADWMQ